MRFTINPFTDDFDCVGLGTGVPVEFIEGNSGGPVGPDPSDFTFQLPGDNATGINTVGDPSTFTLTIFGLPSSTTQVGTTRYATDAEAAAQTIGTVALTPADITSLFSTHPLPASQGGTGLSSPAANSLLVTDGTSPFIELGVATNGEIPIGSAGAAPVLATITAGANITVTNGPGSITIAATGGGGGGGLTWSAISASQTLAINDGYICISPGGALSLALPATSAVGSQIAVILDGATSFTITQSAGQSIQVGNKNSTAGAGGSVASTQQGDSISIVCSVANLRWNAYSSMGNLTVV